MFKKFSHVSASQVSTFLSCKRQWYWNKVVGLPAPQKPSAALGEAVHASIENYLAGEKALHAVAAPGRAKLDELRALSPLVETKMERPLSNGLTFVGRIDLMVPERALVVDHKTTSDLRYAKTEEELCQDVQMLAYAYEVHARTGADEVTVAHNVLLTRGSGHRYTEARIPAPTILSGWKRIEAVTDQMRATATVTVPADVPATLSACDKYGGCPYREECRAISLASRSPYDGLESASSPEMQPTSEVNNSMSKQHLASVLRSMGLDDSTILGAIQRGTCLDDVGLTGAAPAATPAPVVAKVNPPEAPESPRTRKEAAPVATPAPVAKSPEQILREQMSLLMSLGWSQEDIDLLADDTFQDAVRRNIKREGATLTHGTGLVQGQEYDGLIIGVEPAAPTRRLVRTPPAPVVEEPVVEEPVAEKPRRGRKPAAIVATPAPVVEEIVATPAPVVEEIVATPAPVVEEKPAPVAAPVVVEAAPVAAPVVVEGLYLYVDCIPEKGVLATDLSDILAPYMRRVEQTEKVPHYGLVQYNNGEKMVVGFLLSDLAKFQSGHITVDSRLPVAVRALEVLRPLATVVVTGRR